ncbi:MAG: S8 family serine peptidase [Bacteroidales bacterium]
MKQFLIILACFTASGLMAQNMLTSELRTLTENANDEKAEILIYLQDDFDVYAFHQHMLAQKAGKDKRVKSLMRELKNVASVAQTDFLSELSGIKDDGIKQAELLDRFWISNALLMRIPLNKVPVIAAIPGVKHLDVNSGRYVVQNPVRREPDAGRSPGGIENGLEAINAPAMWELGYTGRNTLFLSMDTGVFPEHPAITNRFNGDHVPMDYAWYGVRSALPFDNASSSHGTHTTGTVLGLEAATNDTIGVAWEAYWMATDPVASSESDLLDPADFMNVFQWVLNPDGNPETTNDVPDVINNSWGYDYTLAQQFNACELEESQILEVIEAAGIASPFSAGNEGPGSSTTGFPAMLAYNDLNAMSVGAVNGNADGYPIADFSSRGPTTCVETGDSLEIKPEVSAPGVSVRSCSGRDGYANLSGTSMACPHVSGALLLLKEAFPYLGAYELKQALYATAVDLGDPGEDNTYGRGIIDVYAAYQYLETMYDAVPPVTDSFDVAMEISAPERPYFCPGEENWEPELKIMNHGQETLTEIPYHYSLNYGDTISDVWTGNLLSGESISIPAGPVNLETGFNHLYAWCSLPGVEREYNRFNNADIHQINMVGQEAFPWTEDFESQESDFMQSSWFVDNPDGDRTWDIAEAAGNDDGNRALRMNCLNYLDRGQIDAIYSPVITLPEAERLTLSADFAYQKRMEYLFADTLRIYAATSCGSDFPHLLFVDGGEDMASVEGNSGSYVFVPEVAEDWDTIHMDVSGLAGEDIMLKIEVKNDNGNSIYLDNIRIYEGDPQSLESFAGLALEMFPNPAKEQVSLRFGDKLHSKTTVSVTNMEGQLLMTDQLAAGESHHHLNITSLKRGMYLIKITNNLHQEVRRLVVQ